MDLLCKYYVLPKIDWTASFTNGERVVALLLTLGEGMFIKSLFDLVNFRDTELLPRFDIVSVSSDMKSSKMASKVRSLGLANLGALKAAFSPFITGYKKIRFAIKKLYRSVVSVNTGGSGRGGPNFGTSTLFVMATLYRPIVLPFSTTNSCLTTA